MERFQVHTRANTRAKALILLAVAIAGVGLFELYRLIIPFDSINPLWSEATVGQTVLDNWRYGGQDAEGYLKFYNGSQTALLPPNAHVFDANGKFIVLEQHTPSSITYALPRNALPFSWVLGGAALIAMPIGLIALRLRNRTGWSSTRKVRFRGKSNRGERGFQKPRRARTQTFRPSHRLRTTKKSSESTTSRKSTSFRIRKARFHAKR